MKTLAFIGGLLVAALGATLVALPGPAAGQSGSAVCMAGTTRDGQGRSFTIYLPESRVASLEGRGFRAASCSTATESLAEFRSRACELSQTAPPPFQQAFEQIYGISLGELCTLANEAG
jgi:hypothetical protein